MNLARRCLRKSWGLYHGPALLDQSGDQTATLLDLSGNIPAFIHSSDGKTQEVSVLDRNKWKK